MTRRRLPRSTAVLGALFALCLGACGKSDPAAPATQASVPAVGSPAPSFSLTDNARGTRQVGGASSGWTVLTFFRCAGTPW